MTNRERAEEVFDRLDFNRWCFRSELILDVIETVIDEAEARGRAVTEADPVSLQLAAADDRIDNLEAEITRLRAALGEVAAFMPPDYIDDTDDPWRLDGYTPEDACGVGRDDAFAVVAAIAAAALESEDA